MAHLPLCAASALASVEGQVEPGLRKEDGLEELPLSPGKVFRMICFAWGHPGSRSGVATLVSLYRVIHTVWGFHEQQFSVHYSV